MLRFQDLYCDLCHKRWEELVRVEDGPSYCCGQPPLRLAMAPAVKFIEAHFNKGLGVWVNDAQDLDKKLAKAGSFIPTKTDLARAIENPGGEPAADRKPDPAIRATAEKTWSELHAVGKI